MKEGKSTRVAGGASAFSVVAAGLSCPACFPAMAGLATALGIGSGWAPMVGIDKAIPYFFVLSMLIYSYEVYKHGSWSRYVLMMSGPVVALSAFTFIQSIPLFNVAIGYTVLTAIYNIWKPKHKVCGKDGCSI